MCSNLKNIQKIQYSESFCHEAKTNVQHLMSFLDASPSAYQACHSIHQLLKNSGFKSYDDLNFGHLKTGDKGFYTKNGSAVLAFAIGENPIEAGLRIVGTHTDSPALKLKPHSVNKKYDYYQFACEVYGGALLASWFDRPLALAGRVCLKQDGTAKPKQALFQSKTPLCSIPRLAIHMDREANSKGSINAQQHMPPIWSDAFGFDSFMKKQGVDTAEQAFKSFLAESLNEKTETVLSYDLIFYECAKAFCYGADESLLSSGRLDNLAATQAAVQSFCETLTFGQGLHILIMTDNEEVGSLSAQGADSSFVRDFIESLLISLGAKRQEFLSIFDRSFMISADQAHASHPNYLEAAEENHRIGINEGLVAKIAANRSYASDAYSVSLLQNLMNELSLPLQFFVNRSDKRGGSTIGPITSALIPVPTVDIGAPLLAMHSIRESMGIYDHQAMFSLFKHFFSKQML